MCRYNVCARSPSVDEIFPGDDASWNVFFVDDDEMSKSQGEEEVVLARLLEIGDRSGQREVHVRAHVHDGGAEGVDGGADDRLEAVIRASA